MSNSRQGSHLHTIELLEDALELIESQADGHKASVAYNGGENIALVNIRNIARIILKETRDTRPDEKLKDRRTKELEATILHLSEALQRYGNKKAMSFAVPHLQAAIDDATSLKFEK
jgi:hypothetical protein